MELRHLRYFLAVAEASNFTKAAAQLQVAQPALSRQVKHLEDEIGVELLRRNPRGVTLTAEGRLFLKEARQLLKGAGESVENWSVAGWLHLDRHHRDIAAGARGISKISTGRRGVAV